MQQSIGGDIPAGGGTARTPSGAASDTRRDGEPRYRQLFDAIDQGFCVIEMIFDEAGHPTDYRFIEINAAFEKQTGLKDAVGKTIREIEPGIEEHWIETYGRVARSGESERFEAPSEALGRDYEVFAFRFDNPALGRVGILFNDISKRRQAAELQRIMIAELHHRMRNTLSIVQSIAGLTLRGIDEAVREGFVGRLSALGWAQTLLAESHFRDASLRGVVKATVAPYEVPELGERVSIDGPDVKVIPEAVQSLTLAFHELATNGAKYGALSAEQGRIAVSWRIVRDDDPPRFVLTWQESGGPPIASPPSRTGFGTRLLQQVLALEIGGDVEMDYSGTGLKVTLSAPVENVLTTKA